VLDALAIYDAVAESVRPIRFRTADATGSGEHAAQT